MSLQVIKQYYWKVLTSDGLLKDPKSFGSYYNLKNVNDEAPFNSEEEAVLSIKKFLIQEDYVNEDYVLHCEYHFKNTW